MYNKYMRGELTFYSIHIKDIRRLIYNVITNILEGEGRTNTRGVRTIAYHTKFDILCNVILYTLIKGGGGCKH
jgi:hypothetical protein